MTQTVAPLPNFNTHGNHIPFIMNLLYGLIFHQIDLCYRSSERGVFTPLFEKCPWKDLILLGKTKDRHWRSRKIAITANRPTGYVEGYRRSKFKFLSYLRKALLAAADFS